MIAASLLALALLSAALVRVMISRGVLDIPSHRSSHVRPVPKGGGIGIAAAFLAGFAAALMLGLLPHEGMRVATLLAAGLLIAAFAWLDDVRQFGFAPKLAAQLVAACFVAFGGWAVARVGPVPLGPFAIPITLVWTVYVINAVNFIDGLNGLASGSVLIAALVTADVALTAHAPLLPAALLPLAAGIAGFLPFNYPNARIFMGDVGSQLCGLVIAAAAGPASHLPHHPWGALLVPFALAPVLGDVAFTLARRWRAGDRLTQAHRGHLYQLVHRAGLPAAQITLAFWALTLACATFGAIASRGPAGRVGLCALASALPLAVATSLALRKARSAKMDKW